MQIKNVEELIRKLTIEEKLHMLASGSKGVERLGIPDLRLGGEAAHGVEARNDQNGIGEADLTTSFPQPIGMSSSWDTDAIKAAGRTVGREARICYQRRPWGGISRWAPTVDLLRDPRWGRNEEAYGEDPVQVGAMAAAYIKGIQGDDREHLMAAATLKHFYANNTEIGRIWKNATISPRNKYELYLEPFRRCIEDGGAEGVMTAYNRINGVQGLFNEEVQTLLKDEFGLTHAVSDGGAMELAASVSHVTAMNAETAARSIHAGVDAMSGNPDAVYAAVLEAYELGLLSEEDIDQAIRNVYDMKIRLGLFEGKKEDLGELCDEEAHKVCKTLTDASIVLLKNNGILPLNETAKENCVLIGPVGDQWYQDWYGGSAPEHRSLMDGLQKAGFGTGGEMTFVSGCDHIRLKCGERYVATDAEGRLRLSEQKDTFIMDDWGEGSYTFRLEGNGKYMITRLIDPKEEKLPPAVRGKVSADADRIFSWFDLEVFRIRPEENGSFALCDRFGNRIYADPDGYLLSAAEKDETLTELSFEIEIVRNGLEEALNAAASAETVILALGHNPMVNAKEEIDRSTIEFIPNQQKLFDEIYKVNPNIIVVLMSDYPYAIHEIDRKAQAIVWSATGSQCMGDSLADALSGRTAPAGRLTQTWYMSDADLPDMDDYDIIGKRTYRYFDKEVLYPFGYGLTYSAFSYGDMKATVEHEKPAEKECRSRRRSGQPVGVYDQVRKDDRILRVEVNVTNTGDVVSDEVVQIYAKAPKGRTIRPVKQLIGFTRAKAIVPGETRNVRLSIPVRELAYYDVTQEMLIIEKGDYEISASSSSADPGITCTVAIDGVKPGLRDLTKRIKADHYDEAAGIQIVEGKYGYSAVMAEGSDVYEPRKDGKISVTYADCRLPENAKYLRIHGYAPENAEIVIYLDDVKAGTMRLNTHDYEKKAEPARNHMPRAVEDERRRRASWPLLWADIYIPLDMSGFGADASKDGHVIRIEAEGPIKYDWFMITDVL